MSVLRPPKARSARAPVKGAAFYDVDGTLVDLNLVHATLYILVNLGEWSGRLKYLLNFIARLPMLYAAERRDRHLLNILLFEAFKGISRDRLDALGEEYCERVLIKHIYPQARQMLEANQAAGLEAILVTGSPEFVIAPLARLLSIRDFAANRLVYSRGFATGRLYGPIMAGEQKSAWCEAYAASHRLELSASWAYADSHYDLPFLCAMGHPVAVNPDRQLAATARVRHWPILRFAQPESGRRLAELANLRENWTGGR